MQQCRLIVLGLILTATGFWLTQDSHPVPEAEPSHAVSHFRLTSRAPAGAGESNASRAWGGSLAGQEIPQASIPPELWEASEDLRRGIREIEIQPSVLGLSPARGKSTPASVKPSEAAAVVGTAPIAPGRAPTPSFSPSGGNGRITQAEVDTLEQGLEQALTALERNLVAEVFGETLLLVGDRFRVAWTNEVAAFRYLTTLRAAAVSGLATLNGQADYAPSEVAAAINTKLASAGFSAGSQVVATTLDDQAQLAFATADTFAAANVPIAEDFGLPNLDLHLTANADARTTASVSFDFTVGVDGGGFYLNVTGAILGFDTTTTISALNAAGRFTRLPYTLTDNTGSRTSIAANFAVRLAHPNHAEKLRLADLSGTPDVIDASVTGSTKLSLKLVSSVPPAAMLPQVGTDLNLTWVFSSAELDPQDDNATFGGRPIMSLENNRVNLHSFFNGFAARVLRKIDEATEPLQPVIDVLTAEIPLLSDLGSDAVTILDVVGASESSVQALGGLARLANLAGLASSFAGNESTFIDFGSYVLQPGDLRTDPLEDLELGLTRVPSSNHDEDLDEFIAEANGINGLSFPLLTDGAVVANLLLGRNATLFAYQSGEAGFREEFRGYFPVLGPVGVTLGGRVAVTTEFGFGYDTQGLFDFHAGGGLDPDLLYNGFYVLAVDAQGDPVTGITLEAGITAGVEANVVVASVGVEGDVTATVGIYLDDLLGDDQGRVRGSMLAATPVHQWFYASGSLSAGLRAYLEIGWPPFGVEFEFDSPRVTLISFDSRDTDVPILAEPGQADPTRLVLNVGDRAHRRLHGNTDDRAEEIKITSGLQGLVVAGFGHENTFTDPFVQIVANSGNRGDLMEVHADVLMPVLFTGGDKRDLLTGGGGSDELNGGDGPDKLRGQGGHNVLRGQADNDELIGGLGSNTMDGGPGLDTASWADAPVPVILDLRTGTLSGGAAFDTLISIERYKGSSHDDTLDGSEGPDLLLRGLRGHDMIRGHGGDDLLEGDAGNDTLLGGLGNDMVNGGAGADTMDGGPGMDTLSYLASGLPLLPLVDGSPVTVSLLTGLGTRGDANGDVFSNFEILIGSGVPQGVTVPAGSGDDLTGSDHADTIHGMGGADLIRGAGGNDILYGDNNIFPTEYPADVAPLMAGFDADTIYGGAGDDQLFGQTDDDQLFGGADNDMLDGGLGDDDLDGDGGMDTLVGGEGDDHLISFDPLSPDSLDGGSGTNRLSADYSDHAVPFRFTTGTNNAFTFPGGDRFTNMFRLGSLTTGPGNDVIRLSPREEDYNYSKMINAGGGDDLVGADSRHYYPSGSASLPTGDSVHGGDGNDTLSFESAERGARVSLATGKIFEIDYRPAPPNPDFEFMTMSGFENLIGSEHIDELTGDAGPNIINPLGNGRANQTDVVLPDRIFGGDGVDTLRVDYSRIPLADLHGVNMFVPSGLIDTREIAIWGYQGTAPAGGVVLRHTGFERFEITGGNGPDTLFGSRSSLSFPDMFYGGGGNDRIDSGNGDDLVDGGEGNDDIDVLGGNDIVRGGPGNDRISGNRELPAVDPTQGLGFDLIEAGPGDDFVIDYYPNSPMPIAAHATTNLRLDGGSGFDSLTADFSNQTQPIHFDQNEPSDHSFPDGSWFVGFEKLVDFFSGDGADVLIFAGRDDNHVRLQGGNDILNPGLGKDNLYGGDGDDLLILDFSLGDGPAVAPVFASVSPLQVTTRYERREAGTSTLVDQIILETFERMHVTGSSQNDGLGGLPGNDFLFGGPGNDSLRGVAGHDWLDGGPGADTMDGSGGNDTFIVDDSGDVVTDGNGQGTDTVRSSVNFVLPVNVEILVLTGQALNGTGNILSNNITGNTRNNYLRGEGGNDSLNGGGGAGEMDRLHGGPGADSFILGDGSVRFYDDGSPAGPGLNGYAIIEDFTPSQADRLRLTGHAAEYFLGVSPVLGIPGAALYHDSNGDTFLDPNTDELIAILVSAESLTPANTLGLANYPVAVDPALIGLTAPVQARVIDDGSGPRFAAQFSIFEPMPAGVVLEIQASTDLGFADPWLTLASKNGPGAWAGLAPVSIGTPVDGRVTVTVNDLQPMSELPQRFFRVRLSAP